MQETGSKRAREASTNDERGESVAGAASIVAAADHAEASLASRSDQRAMVFIDGNNWYYALKGIGVHSGRLNYPKIAGELAVGRSVCAVRYYVGRVSSPLRLVEEQDRVLAVLEGQGVEVFLGKIQRNPMSESSKRQRARLRAAFAGREQEVPADLMETIDSFCSVHPPEFVEKQVDTRIAVDLVDLAYRNQYDVAYLLSADADFIPAVEVARRLGRRVFAVAPSGGHELRNAATGFIKVSAEWFEGLYA